MTVRDWRVRCTASLPALLHACVISEDCHRSIGTFSTVSSVPQKPLTISGLYALLAAAAAAFKELQICWASYACCANLVQDLTRRGTRSRKASSLRCWSDSGRRRKYIRGLLLKL